MKFPRLLQAKALPDFQLWVRFQDNTEAVIDFREQLAFPVMRSIATPAAFARVCIAESGSYLYWDVDVPPAERPDASSDWLYLQSVSAELREEFETRLAKGEDWQQTAENLLHKWHNVVVAGIVLLVILVGAGTLSAQTPVLDSLQNTLKAAKEDANKVRLLCKIVDELSYENLPKSVEYALQAKSLAQKLGNQTLLATTLYQLGNTYYQAGVTGSAAELCMESLYLSQKIGDQALEAKALNRMGTIYRRQREYKKAMSLLDSSQQIFRQLVHHRTHLVEESSLKVQESHIKQTSIFSMPER